MCLVLAVGGCGRVEDGSHGEHSPPVDPARARPNVVLIVMDTFRPDHLSLNGYERRTAPFLEGLMERSTVFTQAFSTSSWTAPATSSLVTGLYPMRHGVTEGFLAHRRRSATLEDLVGETMALNRLPGDQETLAELLRGHGYATFGLASNINIGSEIGFDRGFDRFAKLIGTPAKGVSAEGLAEKLSEWREQIVNARPYFLYLHFNDVHKPYEPRTPWFEEDRADGGEPHSSDVAAYDSEIGYLDSVLSKLYADYEWGRETLLVIVSDHGEEFGDHGQYGHLFSLYDELVRVLFVISGETLGIPARRIGVQASLIDVMPTVVDLVGLEPPLNRDGQSLAGLLAAQSSRPPNGVFERRTLFAHRVRRRPQENTEEHLWSAMRMPWKLVIPPRGRPRLYNLESDAGELTDVSEVNVDIAAGLTAELLEFQATTRGKGERIDVEIDEATLEALKALGYVE